MIEPDLWISKRPEPRPGSSLLIRQVAASLRASRKEASFWKRWRIGPQGPPTLRPRRGRSLLLVLPTLVRPEPTVSGVSVPVVPPPVTTPSAQDKADQEVRQFVPHTPSMAAVRQR